MVVGEDIRLVQKGKDLQKKVGCCTRIADEKKPARSHDEVKG
jgi:hypothetical protein